MTAYFIRRLLLVPITFLAITFLVYSVIRILPGGPVEQAQMQRRLAAMSGEGGAGAATRGANLQLDEEALKQLQRFYALDRPIAVGYLQWLGAWPRPFRTRVPETTMNKNKTAFAPLLALHEARGKLQEKLDALLGPRSLAAFQDEIYRPLTEKEQAELQKRDPDFVERVHHLASAGYSSRDEFLALLSSREMTWGGEGTLYAKLEDTPENAPLIKQGHELLDALRLVREEQVKIERTYGYEMDDDGTVNKVDQKFSGILQLDLGTSYTHTEPVLHLIASRMPISAQLGIIGYILTWLVCVPLGIMKAIRHGSTFDTVTSFVVFLGYSIPGYVLCMILLSTLGARGWLPLGGWAPHDPTLSWAGQLAQHIRYMIIPMAGYMIVSFATMTILTKNSLLENLTADYVRTALAKGLTERRAIWVHAVRNSLIPLTANIGTAAGVLFAGSFLIERATNVDGMGLLGYTALIQRDYPIVLGTLVIGLVIQLLGAIVSDLIWASLDPRIRFEVQS